MKLLKPLCKLAFHAWQTDQSMVASNYHHIDPENPPKDNSKRKVPRKQICKRCGKMRIWSFSRGRWRTVG